jgi:peptidoglycan/xylan/chitin deacetylase (PgdA/CDA1 family)
MDFLLKKNFYIASLDEIVGYLKGEIILPQKCVAITFDDGFKDNFTFAYPILRERNIRATIFITTGLIEQSLSFKRCFPHSSISDEKGTTANFLTWREIEIMAKHGLEFEPHSHTHVNLTMISELQAQEEIGISKNIIEKRLGKKARHFCYPYGIYNDSIIGLVEQYGFIAAWTVANEIIRRGLHYYKLPRNGLIGNSPLRRFICIINPCFRLLLNQIAAKQSIATYKTGDSG